MRATYIISRYPSLYRRNTCFTIQIICYASRGFFHLLGSQFQSSPKRPNVLWGLGGYRGGLQWLQHEADQSRPRSAKFRNKWKYTSSPSVHLHGLHQDSFISTPYAQTFPSTALSNNQSLKSYRLTRNLDMFMYWLSMFRSFISKPEYGSSVSWALDGQPFQISYN
jgi:hypothetical protein